MKYNEHKNIHSDMLPVYIKRKGNSTDLESGNVMDAFTCFCSLHLKVFIVALWNSTVVILLWLRFFVMRRGRVKAELDRVRVMCTQEFSTA